MDEAKELATRIVNAADAFNVALAEGRRFGLRVNFAAQMDKDGHGEALVVREVVQKLSLPPQPNVRSGGAWAGSS